MMNHKQKKIEQALRTEFKAGRIQYVKREPALLERASPDKSVVDDTLTERTTV